MKDLIGCSIILLLLLVGEKGEFQPDSVPMLSFGALMILGFFGGRLAARLKLPEVLGFILTGILLGPQLLELLSKEALGYELLNFLIIGCVGFYLGTGLKISSNTLGWKSFGLSFCVVAFAFFLTAGVLNVLTHLPLQLVVLLGAIASAPAPLLVFAVVAGQTKPCGTLLSVVVIGAVVNLTFWAMVFAGIDFFAKGLSTWVTLRPVLEALGTAGVGLFLGWILDRICARLNSSGTIAVLLLGMLFVGYGTSVSLGVHPSAGCCALILALPFGVFIANWSGNTERIMRATGPLSTMALIPLFGVFGAQIKIDAFLTFLNPLSDFWMIAFIYILTMVAGKVLGTIVGMKLFKIREISTKQLGLGVLPQGIVTAALLSATQVRTAGTEALDLEIVTTVVTLGVLFGSLIFPIGMRFVLKSSSGGVQGG